MSGSSKEKLQREEDSTETTDDRELYLRDGRKVVVGENDSLVEIRSPSGMLELRIKLTEEGPVLQMESIRMQLKATESVEIAAKRVEIKAEESVDVVAENTDVRVVGKKIHLN
jgi:phage gp45-like